MERTAGRNTQVTPLAHWRNEFSFMQYTRFLLKGPSVDNYGIEAAAIEWHTVTEMVRIYALGNLRFWLYLLVTKCFTDIFWVRQCGYNSLCRIIPIWIVGYWRYNIFSTTFSKYFRHLQLCRGWKSELQVNINITYNNDSDNKLYACNTQVSYLQVLSTSS